MTGAGVGRPDWSFDQRDGELRNEHGEIGRSLSEAGRILHKASRAWPLRLKNPTSFDQLFRWEEHALPPAAREILGPDRAQDL